MAYAHGDISKLYELDNEAFLKEKNRLKFGHAAEFVTFHDFQAMAHRFQNRDVIGASSFYYQHWVNCVQFIGAGNEHCKKNRFMAELWSSRRQLDEWDDWVKEQHFDLQFGQHWNKVTTSEFDEAAGLMKEVKEKRDELVKQVHKNLYAHTQSLPMSKVKTAIAKLDAAQQTPEALQNLIAEGTLSKEDVRSAAAEKLKQLAELTDESRWQKLKDGLKDQMTSFATVTKARLTQANELEAEFKEQAKKRDEPSYSVPHWKVDYEKPGMYEYQTYFGRFVPRTWQYGFPDAEEE